MNISLSAEEDTPKVTEGLVSNTVVWTDVVIDTDMFYIPKKVMAQGSGSSVLLSSPRVVRSGRPVGMGLGSALKARSPSCWKVL